MGAGSTGRSANAPNCATHSVCDVSAAGPEDKLRIDTVHTIISIQFEEAEDRMVHVRFCTGSVWHGSHATMKSLEPGGLPGWGARLYSPRCAVSPAAAVTVPTVTLRVLFLPHPAVLLRSTSNHATDARGRWRRGCGAG